MYARHVPVSVFSLALVVDGESLLGVVYDPYLDTMYTAIKGKGAYKNDKLIHVSDIGFDDKISVSNYDMWNGTEYDLYDVIKELSKRTYMFSIGSFIRAACCVADGEFSLVLFPGMMHKNCDVAAVKVIVEEAGGLVTDLFGND